MLFKMTDRPSNFFPVPVSLMDGLIGLMDSFGTFFPQLADSAEFARIGRYYATESMLVWDEQRQVRSPQHNSRLSNQTFFGY